MAKLRAPVTVAVYKVSGASTVTGASVNVAIRLVESSDTVPTGLVQGEAQVTVKLAPPVIGAIGSLKAALIIVLLTGTPVALATGATAVTVGSGTTLAPVPKIGLCPPPLPPPQPATKAVITTGIDQSSRLE